MMRKTPALAIALVPLLAPFASAQSGVGPGKTVYADQKCAICHSVAGVGNRKGPLDKVGSALSADDIRTWIADAPAMATKAKADRKPPMKAYSMLPKADVDALVAFLQSLK